MAALMVSHASAALPSSLTKALVSVGVRAYRTGKFTQKMGRVHYKGRGGRKFGFHTTKGEFVLTKTPEYDVPDLTDFKLKPYVSHGTWSGWAKPKSSS
mmetsp:Transcript_10730/g.31838  ORF Transcript_10730/g.31838 Transcript_10730/m.31838 type:complete len:98 (+) Transcript_10730:2-295(+)